MKLEVVVPVNWLGLAKGRLASVLSTEERARLALLTLRTVVDAIADAGFMPTLLTPEPDVLRTAGLEARARVRPEEAAAHGLNGQLEAAVAGLDEVLILHADLPLATAPAIGALVAAAPPAPSVTLVESGDGGTNAMLLRPPGRFSLHYGRASFAAHVAAAEGAAMRVQPEAIPALRLDLDTAADLAALLATEEGRSSAAGRFLEAIGVPGRLGGQG